MRTPLFCFSPACVLNTTGRNQLSLQTIPKDSAESTGSRRTGWTRMLQPLRMSRRWPPRIRRLSLSKQEQARARKQTPPASPAPQPAQERPPSSPVYEDAASFKAEPSYRGPVSEPEPVYSTEAAYYQDAHSQQGLAYAPEAVYESTEAQGHYPAASRLPWPSHLHRERRSRWPTPPGHTGSTSAPGSSLSCCADAPSWHCSLLFPLP
nr:src substrate cortactin-like isoform X2 [Equus asinus]